MLDVRPLPQIRTGRNLCCTPHSLTLSSRDFTPVTIRLCGWQPGLPWSLQWSPTQLHCPTHGRALRADRRLFALAPAASDPTDRGWRLRMAIRLCRWAVRSARVAGTRLERSVPMGPQHFQLGAGLPIRWQAPAHVSNRRTSSNRQTRSGRRSRPVGTGHHCEPESESDSLLRLSTWVGRLGLCGFRRTDWPRRGLTSACSGARAAGVRPCPLTPSRAPADA